MSSIKRKRAALGLPLTQLTGHAQTPTKSDKSSDKAVEASSVSKTSIHRSQPELDQSVKPFVGEFGRTDSSFPHFIMTGDNSVLHCCQPSKTFPPAKTALDAA
ncbi:3185_t:CDS:1, partial [Paraglomus brasilianum]